MASAKSQRMVFFYSFLFFLVVSLAGFVSSGMPNERKGVHAKLVADYIHSVIEAGRTFYSKQVVERLGKAISLRATENWVEDNTLPLPAQFLIASSKISNSTGVGMNYSLMSLWPLNKKNGPKTDFEKSGLRAVVDDPGKPFTWVVQRKGLWYFQAIYPDRAVTQSCVSCHNSHPQSRKRDYKIGDVMGGIVINIALGRFNPAQKEDGFLVPPENVADFVHAVIGSDRRVYSRDVVDRLGQKNIVRATENWMDNDTLPLPAQFLTNASKLTDKYNLGLGFRLISLWPINKKNRVRNKFEQMGLESVSIHPIRPYISQVKVGKVLYFKAVYPDLAVEPTCVNCHNKHPQSAKKDFKLRDVMGGVVVSFPLKGW